MHADVATVASHINPISYVHTDSSVRTVPAGAEQQGSYLSAPGSVQDWQQQLGPAQNGVLVACLFKHPADSSYCFTTGLLGKLGCPVPSPQ
jgi:hypothetical protein